MERTIKQEIIETGNKSFYFFFKETRNKTVIKHLLISCSKKKRNNKQKQLSNTFLFLVPFVLKKEETGRKQGTEHHVMDWLKSSDYTIHTYNLYQPYQFL